MKFAAAPCLLETVPQTSSIIPWWSDLSDAARVALQLTTLTASTLAETYDLVVVGAGIAGLSATLEAARTGTIGALPGSRGRNRPRGDRAQRRHSVRRHQHAN